MRGGQVRAIFTGLLFVVFLTALLLLFLPLTDPRLAPGSDTRLHIGNIVESAFLLKHRLPPWDWLPDIAGGYGGPNYSYYAPLPFVLPAALVNLGLSPSTSAKVLIACGFAVGLVSSFLLARRHGGVVGGAAAAILYSSGPYLLSLPYARGSYPEFVACSFYPLLFLFAEGWIERHRGSSLIAGALTFATILGIHTLSLAIIGPFLVLYAAALSPRRGGGLVRGVSLLALGMVIAAPYLVGPLFERHKVALSEQFTTAVLVENLGIPWYSLINERPLDDVASHARAGRMHVLVWLASALIATYALERTLRRKVFICLFLAGLALFLCEEHGARLAVQVLPPLRYLQFPWRLLSVFGLFVSAALAIVLSPRGRVPGVVRLLLAIGVIAGCALRYGGEIPEQRATGFITSTREGIRRSLTTLDHEDKYMPVGIAKPRKVAPEVLLELREAEGSCVRLIESGLNDYTFTVSSPTGGSAEFHQLWWDAWRAAVDGEIQPLSRDPERGTVLLSLPPGAHTVRLRLEESPMRRYARWLSRTTLVACALVLGFSWFSAARRLTLS